MFVISSPLYISSKVLWQWPNYVRRSILNTKHEMIFLLFYVWTDLFLFAKLRFNRLIMFALIILIIRVSKSWIGKNVHIMTLFMASSVDCVLLNMNTGASCLFVQYNRFTESTAVTLDTTNIGMNLQISHIASINTSIKLH